MNFANFFPTANCDLSTQKTEIKKCKNLFEGAEKQLSFKIFSRVLFSSFA